MFVPAAIGPVINPETSDMLEKAGVRGVAGSANNLLEDVERDAEGLRVRNIVFFPDYFANGRGVRSVNGHLGH